VPPARIFVLSCTHAGSVVRHHIAAHVDDSDPSQSKSDVRSRMHWVALLQRAIDDAQGRAARSRKGALSRTMSLHASPARDKALSPTISRPSSRSAAPAALAAPPLPAVPSTAGEPDDAGDADEGTTAMPNTVGSGATTEEIALLSANAHRIENACVLPEDAEPMPSTRASSSFAPAPVPMPDDYVIVNPLSLRQRAASNELSVDVRSGMRELASALNETSAYVPIAAKFDTYVSDVAAVSDDEQGDDDNDDGSDDSVVIHGDDVAVLVQSDGEVPPDVPEPPQFGSSDDVPPAMPASPPDTPPSPTEPPPPPPPQTHYDGVPDKATWHRNAKHACVACKRAVTGEVLKALGGVWHRGCFRCTHCRVHLSSSFVEFDSQPYCKADFMQLFAPRCAACNLPVAEQVVRAVGLSFHEECFACSVCNASLANKPYFEVNGRPACQLCGSAPPAKPMAPAKPKRK
jgi:hypothetical protein